MEKLNQSIFDITKLISDNIPEQNGLLSFIKGAKKAPAKSLLDDIEQQDLNIPQAPVFKKEQENININEPVKEQQYQNIIVPQSIVQQAKTKENNTISRAQEAKLLLQFRRKKTEKAIVIPPQMETAENVLIPLPKYQQKAIQQLPIEQQKIFQQLPIEKQQQILTPVIDNHTIQQQALTVAYEEKTGDILPENIDIVEIAETITDAIDEIPGAENLELSDFKLTEIVNRKDRTGYTKVKVTIRDDKFPTFMSKLATEVKRLSKSVVLFRKMDFRTIGNTNKTQLRNESLKLTGISANFKPNPNLQKVNKGTRFIISVPDDYNSSKNLIVYIQESRDKFITIIEGKSFHNEDEMIAFFADVISKYYTYGFDLTKRELSYKDVNSPLLAVMKNVLSSNRYKTKIKKDDESGKVTSMLIISKEPKNQWMGVSVRDGQVIGTYIVTCISKIDSSWRQGVNNPTGAPVTISDLTGPKFIKILDTLYDREWNIETEDNKEYFLIDKLTYRKLKDAFIQIYNMEESHPDFGVMIKETLSQIDTAKALNESGKTKDYAAEGIIGKTNFLDYFILTYMAVQIVGGDKRHGKDFITTNEYREKYAVKDDRDYNERRGTILKKGESDRNYNSRPYMFQLEYSIKGKVGIYISKEFSDVLNVTNFLTDYPKIVNSK